MSRTYCRLLAASALLIGAVASACAATDPLLIPSEPDAARLRDLPRYAERRGEPLGPLVEQHAGMEEVGALAMELESDHPDLFVRWGVSRLGEPGDYWILLTAQPDPAMLARIDALPAEVIVIIGATATSEELSAIKGALVSALLRHPDVYLHAGTRTDRFTSDITVEYGLTDEARVTVKPGGLARYEAEALEAARVASNDGVLPVRVVFRQVFTPPPVLE